MKNMLNLLATSALLCATMVNTQAATYYKWTEANGTPHYSDTMPTNGVNLKKIQIINTREDARLNAAAGVSPTANADATMTPEQKRIKELESQNQQQQVQQTKDRCQALQAQNQNLAIGGRVYRMENGERKYLDSREMELQQQQNQQLIQQYCK